MAMETSTWLGGRIHNGPPAETTCRWPTPGTSTPTSARSLGEFNFWRFHLRKKRVLSEWDCHKGVYPCISHAELSSSHSKNPCTRPERHDFFPRRAYLEDQEDKLMERDDVARIYSLHNCYGSKSEVPEETIYFGAGKNSTLAKTCLIWPWNMQCIHIHTKKCMHKHV